MPNNYNLKKGDPKIVRQALIEVLGPNFEQPYIPLIDMAYTPHHGSPYLIEQLKYMAEQQSGHRPKYLFITCGASGAINAALYALKTEKTHWVVTNERFFFLYPDFIAMSDMIMIDKNKKRELCDQGCEEKNFISLVDSPSSPDGKIYPFESVDIWDAAYASKTYSSGGHTPTQWKIMCGSLSKTLGLPGLRLGYVCTDDESLAMDLETYITNTYVGLSGLSMLTAESILDNIIWDEFYLLSSRYLDNNREQVQKVLDKFGQGSIPSRGMFAAIQLGKLEKKALKRAGVTWQCGSTWGEDDSWGRLSLGNSRQQTELAVKAILK